MMRFFGFVLALLSAWSCVGQDRPLLVINEDNDHYFKLSPSRMTREALEAYADSIVASGRVTHVVFCTCGQRASFASKAWEPIWAGLGGAAEDGRPHDDIWCLNAKRLYDAGIDPYEVWLKRVKSHGVQAWLSLRANDLHGVTVPNYFRDTTWWRTHPQYYVVPNSVSQRKYDYALDFAVAEVRDYTFAMADELLTRYDADGLELDLTRHSWYFRPGHEREDAHFLTEFVARVRTRAREQEAARGHRIGVAVRVPTTLASCKNRGMDVVEWARRGLVDFVSPANNYSSMPMSLPLKQWSEAIAAVSDAVTVIPSADMNVGAFPDCFTLADLAAYRGWAVNMYAEGAKGLYLFNAPYNQCDGSPDALYAGELVNFRRLRDGELRFVRAFNESYGYDKDVEGPRATGPGGPWYVKLPSRGVPKRVAEVVLGFVEKDAPGGRRVRVNGKMVDALPQDVQAGTRYPAKCGTLRAWAVDGALFKPGLNEIGLDEADGLTVCWCEIRFKGVLCKGK